MSVYAIPERLLRAGPGQSQTRCQAGRGVAQPLVCLCGLGQSNEHGTADPLFDEGLDVPGIFERCGDALIRRPPLFAGHRVLDASGAADQNESTDVEVRTCHHMKGDTRPEGVAQEVTTAGADGGGDGIAHQRCRRRQVGAHGIRSGVTRQVESDQDVVLRQQIAEGPPQSSRLGESVQKDNRRRGPRTALVDMEWHAW